MTSEEKTQVAKLVNVSLDNAESVWDEVGKIVTASAALANESSSILNRAKPVPTQIPGHEFIEDGKPLVDNFIAFVLDMRSSSDHLNMAIADTEASELKRVYYETAAILPACSRIIKNNEGGVTEYLGDGLLAFFKVEADHRDRACYHAHDAAIDCLDAVKDIVNPILKERYRLPPLNIGIGMAYSKAILTLTGESTVLKPIAFGKCVFGATKLSKGNNEVFVDDALRLVWPESEDGPLKFVRRNVRNFEGYLMYST